MVSVLIEKLLENDSQLTLLLTNSGIYEVKKMEQKRNKINLKSIVMICLFLAVTGILVLGYYCQDQVCALSKREMIVSQQDVISLDNIHDNLGKPLQQNLIANPGLSYEEVLNDDFQFDMNAHDVMVFLHVQKTGGTSFGRHLVRDLDLKRPCTCQRKKKRCYCFRPHRNENWLFSRYSTGWKCGLHADWTELTGCVDQELDKNEGETAKRRYFYITLLREPIARYLSEFRHVQRGATWKNSRHWCMGRQATAQELPACYRGENWFGVFLDDFANCDSNLAANRQTRMLADLALVGCYNKSSMPSHERDRVMLASAKRNLAAMAYFGLTENQKISQYIFEETFNLRFAIPFEQHNNTVSINTLNNLAPSQRRKIEKLNSLDMELYAFAKRLMFQRFEKLKAKDNDFEVRFAHLGNIGVRNGVTEFNWDSNIDNTQETRSIDEPLRTSKH